MCAADQRLLRRVVDRDFGQVRLRAHEKKHPLAIQLPRQLLCTAVAPQRQRAVQMEAQGRAALAVDAALALIRDRPLGAHHACGKAGQRGHRHRPLPARRGPGKHKHIE